MTIHKRVFHRDPVAGTTEYLYYDDDTDQIRMETEQDIEPLAELAQYVRHGFDERARWKGDMHHVASVPMTVYEELRKKGILQDKVALRKWLNDPDNRVFRTRPGRV